VEGASTKGAFSARKEEPEGDEAQGGIGSVVG
jgi:hypothetical protein